MPERRQPPATRVRFWGVRGSIPTPETDKLGYGGNTSCVEIRYAGRPPFVIDAGSGIRSLGRALLEESDSSGGSVHVFLTHFHWDHVQGIPFFGPLYDPRWHIAFHTAKTAHETAEIVGAQMKEPGFSAETAIRAECKYGSVSTYGVQLDEVLIRQFPLFHPGGACGYRIQTPDSIIVYACDHEHGDAQTDRTIRRYAEGADILIYDSMYTPEEYERKKGWGHSTWREATRVAKDAGVKQLVLHHHDPSRGDEEVTRNVSNAAAEFERTLAAREGLTIVP